MKIDLSDRCMNPSIIRGIILFITHTLVRRYVFFNEEFYYKL